MDIEKTIKSQLYQRIKAARVNAGFTQSELAVQCGVSRAAVALWESGDEERRTFPAHANLEKISNATGAPLYWLLSDESELNKSWEIATAEKQEHFLAPIVNKTNLDARGYCIHDEEFKNPDYIYGYVNYYSSDPDAVAAKILNSVTSFRFIPPGWFLIIEPNRAPEPGDFVGVLTSDEERFIAECLYIKDTYTFELLDGSRLTLDKDKIFFIGPISAILPPWAEEEGLIEAPIKSVAPNVKQRAKK